MRIVWGLVVAFAVLLAGFWPSFFSNVSRNDTLHTLHGIFATGWMIILIAQAWLMAKGHLKIHHWIGRLSIFWMAGLVYTAVKIMIFSLGSTQPHALPVAIRPILASFDIPSIFMFTAFYLAAIYCGFKRYIDTHYRLMISTVIIVMFPAVFRALQYFPFHTLGSIIHPSFWIMELTCIGLLVYDAVKYRKTFVPYWLTLATFLWMELAFPYVTQFAPFMTLIRAFGYPA